MFYASQERSQAIFSIVTAIERVRNSRPGVTQLCAHCAHCWASLFIKIFLSKLSDSYETRTLIFGNQSVESDSFVFDHNQSNLGQLFTQVENQFNTSNLTDLIVASDGIINAGKVNATLENTNVKIHTLLLGDTNTNPDVSIQKVRTNKYAVLNNNFPLA